MDIFPSREQHLNPFPFYSQMRKYHPITYDDKNKLWGIFRYHDIQAILTNYKHFSSDVQVLVNMQQAQSQQGYEQAQGNKYVRRSLLTSDPPHHSRLRGIISSAFTSNRILSLRLRIEEICNDLLDKIIDQGSMDLIDDLAYPLPVTVIAEMVGVPVGDRDTFRKWADELIGSTSDEDYNIPTDRIADQRFKKVQDEMDYYFIKIIISSLLRAEIDGNKLSEEDIFAFCSLLLLAGHVTTVNLIGNMVRSLLEHPQQLKQLIMSNKIKNDKNSNLNLPSVQSAIDETLRYRSPVQALFRFAMQDVNIEGQKIQRGQRMILWIGSANRDEYVFPDAEKFDIARTFNSTHLAFGHGIHFCLGSTLANLEAQVVLKIILERLNDLRFADDYREKSLEPLHGIFFNGVRHLPLCFKPIT
jgi:cytochrome P450